MTVEERIVSVAHNRHDYSFPWHLEVALKRDGRWVRRLRSRHRTQEAANRAKAALERKPLDYDWLRQRGAGR